MLSSLSSFIHNHKNSRFDHQGNTLLCSSKKMNKVADIYKYEGLETKKPSPVSKANNNNKNNNKKRVRFITPKEEAMLVNSCFDCDHKNSLETTATTTKDSCNKSPNDFGAIEDEEKKPRKGMIGNNNKVKVLMTKEEATRLLSKCKDGGLLEFKDVVNELVHIPINRLSLVSSSPCNDKLTGF
ncbi:OLC1v1030025C1 [Oldenlandia corymbosa var. corymbosa]|uniref:OLC1v1030025C1 n=1 Tax=Oldenlandia corymbosa var. corymbosa TaxID=529605 RepID=A0AAV1CGM8_OLDCO|nr:OLC1v1030025C1 [Oldenlandia corymbosa var. corymbosa]